MGQDDLIPHKSSESYTYTAKRSTGAETITLSSAACSGWAVTSNGGTTTFNVNGGDTITIADGITRTGRLSPGKEFNLSIEIITVAGSADVFIEGSN